MVYDLSEARLNIRTVFPNAGERTVPDEILDLAIVNGLRRLSSDRPDTIEHTLSAPFNVSYPLTAFTRWEQGFSAVRRVTIGPRTGVPYVPEALDRRRYRVTDSDFFVDTSGLRAETLIVEYTAPWLIKDVDGASATTLSPMLEGAHMWISCRFLALSLAAKMAGATDRQLPADFINFRTRSDEFRALAKEFEENYRAELGLLGKQPAPVIVSEPASSTPPSPFWTYTTHRSTGDWR